jgi:flagellar hook-basal body complex protein FliE
MSLQNTGGVDFPRPILPDVGPSKPAQTSDGPSFTEFLGKAVGDANTLQSKADDMVARYATGERMDVHQVMIAIEKASTAMALTTQVRNKVIDAYQEIMRTNL